MTTELPGRALSRRTVLSAVAATAALGAADALLPATRARAEVPATTSPAFGPNVFVFDPTSDPTAMQAQLDALFAQQGSDQFGTGRYAVLVKPGSYDLDANLGYYTTIAGLGLSPDDVEITGAVRVVGQSDPGSAAGITALTNFWRSAENLAVTPTVTFADQWAVSQGSPLRRMHIKGILWLEPGNGGFSSGGYLANSKVDGITINGSQQQWLTRDSELGDIWTNGVWNQVFSGVTGETPTPDFPNNPYTVLATSPVTREKPFLYVDSAGDFQVFVPAVQTNTAGTTWSSGQPEAGTSVSLDDFYLAQPSDTAATINRALARGMHLLLTPGIYSLTAPITITRPGTIVLGLGMATLVPTKGTAALLISDVDGVRISSVIVDAGPKHSAVLVRVGGPAPTHHRHAADPTSLHDVFFRIGGATPGKAHTALLVNSDDVILDDIWAWRADHGAGVGWTLNPAINGVVVAGNNVTAYGLFVEHFQQYQTLWQGQGGQTIFYQSELPYDVPSQAAWNSPTAQGWASYHVGPHIRTHRAWGLGVYSNFNQGIEIVADQGIDAPTLPTVAFTDLTTVFLDGKGGINHVIDAAGAAVLDTFGTATVVSYP